MANSARYLKGIKILPELVEEEEQYPFHLPFIQDLELAFTSAVTFFVGENGSGKSTLLEAGIFSAFGVAFCSVGAFFW